MEVWTGWLILAGICFVAEFLTEGFLVCWFGVGALVAMGLSFVTDNFVIQLVAFAIVSTILILSTRKLGKKMQAKQVPMNVYTIIGKKAVVSTEIDNVKGQGQIKVDGDIWSAKNEIDDEPISEGTAVEIIKIDGVKAIVKKI